MVFVIHRLQALREPVYSQKEADMAAGMGNYILKAPDVSMTDTCMKDSPSDSSSPDVLTVP